MTSIMKQPERQTLDARTDGLVNLVGLNRDELIALFASFDFEKFRSKQVWQWLYAHGLTDFGDMTNMGKDKRALLENACIIERATIDEDQLSSDGTRKWLMRFGDNNQVETVYIPEEDRGTLCISSQVGCTLACTFCHTGTQKLVRNLSAGEIIGQVLCAADGLGEWPIAADTRQLSNIVFMGMGEPLFNYDHVAKACEILIDRDGLAFSRRRVTISTSGVVPQMVKMTDDLGVNLAISLHAVNDELRNEIVPINRKYPLKELIDAMRYYHEKHPSRRIMIEYVMLKDVNDSDAEAHQMAELLEGIPVKINLIPFNPWPGSSYVCSSGNRMHAFKRILENDYHLPCPIRKTRGQDILAACGQLKSESERKKGQKVKLQ